MKPLSRSVTGNAATMKLLKFSMDVGGLLGAALSVLQLSSSLVCSCRWALGWAWPGLSAVCGVGRNLVALKLETVKYGHMIYSQSLIEVRNLRCGLAGQSF